MNLQNIHWGLHRIYADPSGIKNISSLHLEFLWQPEKNQKKKVVFPERREGGIVVLTERSEVKTVPPERREGKTFFWGLFLWQLIKFSGYGIRFLWKIATDPTKSL